MAARLHLNKFGVFVRAGYAVEYHHPRGGKESGTVARIAREGDAWCVKLTSGATCCLDDIATAAPPDVFPRIERGCLIEVPRPRRGRPGYVWVQGWVVRYGPGRVSVPLRLQDARSLLRSA